MSNSNSTPSRSGSSGPFAYQTRLLESTSTGSRGGGLLQRTSSLARTNSISSRSSFSASSDASPSPTPTGTRKWTPSHRVGASLDAVRGKWEERARAEATLEGRSPSLQSREDVSRDDGPSTPSSSRFTETAFRSPSSDHLPASPSRPTHTIADYQKTPTYLKRHTMPAPIVASALSPNNTGVTVENDSPTPYTPSSPHRIRLPSSASLQSSSISSVKHLSDYAVPASSTDLADPVSPSPRTRRANTFDTAASTAHGDASSFSSNTSLSSSRVPNFPSPSTPTHRRPTSIHARQQLFSSNEKTLPNTPRFESPERTSLADPPTPQSPSSSVMAPSPYRSSYMSNKKAPSYGENLIMGRRLGKHLPRIASGDAEDELNEDSPQPERSGRRERLEKRQRFRAEVDLSPDKPVSPSKLVSPDLVIPGVTDSEAVAGIPGRIRLSRDKMPSAPTSPLPSARLARGLWADTQRHLIQAYEYLCHVGEAQQWIEGCLGEELGFGVVEMEEGLRNGVVLAKLVRVFQGESAVRRIYEAPKLDFRHSDNINHFFLFVRAVGLPEGFIFELTDLYEKKNLPKVIYCIHALSHLLARRGLAERIGNLLGRLQFSDDQLQATQKGLKDAGVAMPNFGNVGKELAKEINEEPEVEVETEDERRDRLLLENEPSIIAVQAQARGFLAARAHATQRTRFSLVGRYILKAQSQCRGVLARRHLAEQRKQRTDLIPWAIALQSHVRGLLVRRRWHSHVKQVRASSRTVVKMQAQIRGVLQRRRFGYLKAAMRSSSISVVKLQTLARARLARRVHTEASKTFAEPAVQLSTVALQAHARGVLARRKVGRQYHLIQRSEPQFVALQAQCRGVIMRRRLRRQMAKLEDVSQTVVRIQAAVRTYLARKRLLMLIRGLRKATPMVVGLQARARANLARQRHENMNKALSEVKVITAVGTFQARARAALARNRHREQSKQFEFAEPDVVGIQSAARGALVRRDYHAWRDHLWRSQPVATILQAMLRGVMLRRSFRAKMEYYRSNLDKVVKIQSLFRAKETREQYRQLTLGTNVNVGTIKNFVHLLDDSEWDFKEELKVERLRKRVVEGIRENQALEHDVSDLDVKIALVVQNVKSFEELIKVRRKHGADSAAVHAARASILAAHGDPFAGSNTLDHSAKRKLELYQQLFYLLQTRPEYWSRLFLQMSIEATPEKNRRLTERVVLTLFGYGQDRREDYLLLKLFQLAIQDEAADASALEDIVHSHPMYINIAVHYLRPKQITYVRDALQTIIREAIGSEDLDLEADPTIIHRNRINREEMRTGVPSTKPKDLPFYEALNDPDTRAQYIRHLQVLQWWTEAFVTAITQSTKKMPYGIRYMARETLNALREKFPDAPPEMYAACIGRLVYYRYINPAIITPETFDIVSTTVDISARKNLAQISKIITQITGMSEFADNEPSYIPINDYVRKAITEMSQWLIEVANVPDAETQFHAHEFLDVTAQPKPIYISPNEVYAMHTLLAQNLDHLAPEHNDTLRIILGELDGVPNLGTDELTDARDKAITLELTNRFAHVRDARADEKALWVQAKRGVLAILRVQPGQDLVESLMRPVTDEDEIAWENIIEAEMDNEQIRQHPGRMPSQPAGDSAYRLEDIRSLTFKKVKAHAIFFLLELEKQGKITRNDGFQGILNAIAGDVRSKHRKRLLRQQELDNMEGALRHLAERKKYFEEQINSYHDYVEAAMATMQRGKGKKRFVLPFTKQFYHLREINKAGEAPQFGSFKYSAKDLYDKGILLSIDQFSPRQFDKIDLIMSSNRAGIFTLELFNNTLGITNRLATQDLRMEDLLQARFENRASMSLFNGLVKVNLDLLLFQINKKFYV
ncbi:hypothetical protein PLICRDRAFT_127987 [Plicaturopsis crispa FD-325 SS-3]|nr:hypothetical protein PLICRDRAFT_127987 [Plicaturopsis crispa FD-325 SS-3]